MSDHLFWLSDPALQPLLPNKPRGVPRVDDRRVISGIVHVIRNGLMWRDAPAAYGPHKTLYNASCAGAGRGCSTGSSRRLPAAARRPAP